MVFGDGEWQANTRYGHRDFPFLVAARARSHDAMQGPHAGAGVPKDVCGPVDARGAASEDWAGPKQKKKERRGQDVGESVLAQV